MLNLIPSNPLFLLLPGQKRGIINYLTQNGDKDYKVLAEFVSKNLKEKITEDQLADFYVDYLNS